MEIAFPCIRYYFIVIFTVLCATAVTAQTPPRELDVPAGTSLNGLGGSSLAFSAQSLWLIAGAQTQPVWSAPLGSNLIDVAYDKHVSNNGAFLVNDGSFYEFTVTGSTSGEPIKVGMVTALLPGQEQFKKMLANPLEVLTNRHVYTSHDGGINWIADTAGFGTAFNNDIASDSGLSLVTVTNGGIFRRGVNDASWTHDTSLHTLLNMNALFIDRTRRMFISTQASGVYVSADHGVTWTVDSIGLGKQSVTRFNDDAFGNIYAVISGGQRVYRLANGAQSWTRIDSTIIATYPEPIAATTFYNVGGDSLVRCATVFGMFASSDQGITWQEHNAGMQAENVGTIEHVPGGRVLVTTDLGIFKRESGDTVWTRTFPAAGYLHLGLLYHDGTSNYYVLAQHSKAAPNTVPRVTYKSADKGATWTTDTAGLSVVRRAGTFFVDETGAQHMAVSGAQGTPGACLYAKPVGGAWAPDTSGFISAGTADAPTSIVSDQGGKMYVSGTFSGGNTWSRSVSGTAWSLDTAGADSATMLAMRRDAAGNIYAGSKHGRFFKHAAGRWSSISAPAGYDTSDAYVISADSTGALVAGYRTLTGGFFQTYNGAFITKNAGGRWIFGGLASYTLANLVSYGDTTYAMIAGRGAFRIMSVFAPAIHLVASNLQFGTVNIGEFSEAVLSISNTGTDSLHITGITIDNPAFVPRFTAVALPPGAVALDTIRFTPTTTGSITGNISVVSDAATSPTAATATGTGRSSNLQLSARTFSFGATRVGSVSKQVLTLTNTSAAPVTVTAITASQPVFSAKLTAVTIPVGGSVDDTLQFSPTALPLVSGTLIVVSSSPSSPDTILVTGSGKAPRMVFRSDSIRALVGDSLHCGSTKVNNAARVAFVIANAGTDTLHITSVSSTNIAFTPKSQIFVLAPGQWTTDTVTFVPSTADTFRGKLIVSSDDAVSFDTIFVNGIGTTSSSVAESIPEIFSVGEAYPNPISRSISATIPFSLKEDGRVEVTLVDALGRRMGVVTNELLAVGEHRIEVSAASFSGLISGGVFFAEFHGAGKTVVRRIVVVK